MGGAVLPLLQYAFVAWCSVRGSTGTTLPLSFLKILGYKVVEYIQLLPMEELFEQGNKNWGSIVPDTGDPTPWS
jgi:hypothetical protein